MPVYQFLKLIFTKCVKLSKPIANQVKIYLLDLDRGWPSCGRKETRVLAPLLSGIKATVMGNIRDMKRKAEIGCFGQIIPIAIFYIHVNILCTNF